MDAALSNVALRTTRSGTSVTWFKIMDIQTLQVLLLGKKTEFIAIPQHLA